MHPPEMLGGYKQNIVCTRAQGKELWSPKRLSQTCLSVWGSPAEAGLAAVCPGDRDCGSSHPGRLRVWRKSSWRSLPLASVESHWVGDPRNGEQLCQSSSHTAVKGPTTSQPRYPATRLGSPLGIWLWRPVGFDRRTSTGLGKQKLLEGADKTLCGPGPRKEEQRCHQRQRPTCPWVSGSLWWRRGLPLACHGVRGTECSRPGRHGILA